MRELPSTNNKWNQLAPHFDLHDAKLDALDFASAANRMIAWPAILSLLKVNGMQVGNAAVDFGCGTGGLCELLLRGGCRVHGIDRSAAMVATARQKTSSEIVYSIGEFSDISRVERADILTCSLVLNYLSNLNSFAADAEMLLCGGGLLVTADLNRSYVAACIAAGLIYENFDSSDEPRHGVLNFGNDIKVPLTVRSEPEYDEIFLERGWMKVGAMYPQWPDAYVNTFRRQFPEKFPLGTPKYQVLAYRWK